MKRILFLLLAIALLLVGCSEETHSFVRSAQGLLDEETGICYREQEASLEASRAGEEIGRIEGSEQILYAIPDLDPSLFLTDDLGAVYYAGEAPVDPAHWQIDRVLVCRVVGEMDEVKRRFEGEAQAATVAALCAAWFEGEDLGADVFLLEKVAAHYPVKLGSAAYPNLYCAIELRLTEGGGAYLTDKYGKRTVLLDAALAELLCGEN